MIEPKINSIVVTKPLEKIKQFFDGKNNRILDNLNDFEFTNDLEYLFLEMEIAYQSKLPIKGSDRFFIRFHSENNIIKRAINNLETPCEGKGTKILKSISNISVMNYINQCLQLSKSETYDLVFKKLNEYFDYEYSDSDLKKLFNIDQLF